MTTKSGTVTVTVLDENRNITEFPQTSEWEIEDGILFIRSHTQGFVYAPGAWRIIDVVKD